MHTISDWASFTGLVWQTFLIVGIIVGVVSYVGAQHSKALIEALRSTAEGYRIANDQLREENKDIKDRLARLEKDHNDVLRLNLDYQREREQYEKDRAEDKLRIADLERERAKDKDRIADLEREIVSLTAQVEALRPKKRGGE